MQNYSFQMTNVLTDSVATRIWEDYQARIMRITEPLPFLQREEILLEIQSHIWESITCDSAPSEAEKLLNATRKMGHPEVYLQSLVGTKLLENASHSFNPAILAKSLTYMIGGNRLQSLLVLVMSVLYTMLFVLASMVCTKLFFPENVGLFSSAKGTYSFGYIVQTEPFQDVLGYWFIPLGLLVCGVIYMIMTKIAFRIVQAIVSNTITMHEE